VTAPDDELLSVPGLFVTGTDTDIGKTYVTSMIVRRLIRDGIRVGVYKPVCSGACRDSDGNPRWSDVERLSAAVGDLYPLDRVCPQRFLQPLAPPVAARLEGRNVDFELLRSAAGWWNDKVETLVVEGVGGLLCPLTDHKTVADLAADLKLPLLIVGGTNIGTINHTLLTIEVATRRGLDVAGIVLSQQAPSDDEELIESSLREIERRTDVAVLGFVPAGGDTVVLNGAVRPVDWQALTRGT